MAERRNRLLCPSDAERDEHTYSAKLRITEAMLNDEKLVAGKTIDLGKIISVASVMRLHSGGTKSAEFPLFPVFTICG
jgi:hypothetical protein